MFRYSSFLDTLFKAMTHKYVRRIPKGVTKTGATKYMYFYAGQEGHGHGIAHENELVTGASFAFGEHGKTRYHAHISKVDGDKVTVKYDDGAKKGTEETMTKKQFQALVRGEHATGIKQAQAKAEKQLKDFQAGKEKGVKVKQSTLDKLEAQVNKLKEATKDDGATKQKNAYITKYKDTVKNLVDIYRAISSLTQDKKTPVFSSDAVDVQGATKFISALNSDKYKDKSSQEIADELSNQHAKDYFETDDELPRDASLYAYSLNQHDSPFHNPEVQIVSSFDKEDWANRIKPALTELGMTTHMKTLNFDGQPQGKVKYALPVSLFLKNPNALNTVKELFENVKEVTKQTMTQEHQDYIDEYDGGEFHGYDSHIFHIDQVGEDIDDFSQQDPSKLYLFVEGTFDDKDKLYRKYGMKFAGKSSKRGISYYRFPKPVSSAVDE